jgi:hypothetical protein
MASSDMIRVCSKCHEHLSGLKVGGGGGVDTKRSFLHTGLNSELAVSFSSRHSCYLCRHFGCG